MSDQSQLEINEESKLDSVETYKFEPIKGYPMLNWRGKRPFTSTQFYPAQLKENHGEPVDGWMNRIYWGDNLQVMSHLLKEFRGKVDLIYIDPPFDSKADYKKNISVRSRSGLGDYSGFEEKQYSDIWTNDGYLQFMYERICLFRELLSDKGSLMIHCDHHANYQIRSILDEIFGKESFVNEIVWKRAKTVKGNTGQGSRFLGHNADFIYWYSKTSNYQFNQQFEPYTEQYIEDFYKYTEPETGKRYQLISMTAPGNEMKGNPHYEVMGVTRYWRYSKEKMASLIASGMVVQTSPGNVPRRKLYLEDGLGVPVQSIWTDIDGLSSQSGERVGYPTQKPERLLERLIACSTNEGDLIFDCFMGSGTTQAVASKTGRRFLGADINLGAIHTSMKRLLGKNSASRASKAAGFSVYNVNNYEVFQNPVQAKDLLIEALEIQPLPKSSLYDGEKDGRMVKIMPVNRIATKADLTPLITGFDYKSFQKKQEATPNRPVESLLLVCMGHEPDLAAHLKKECPFELDVEVVDILRDKANLHFTRDSEAELMIEKGKLSIAAFYPMNLLQKLSVQKEKVEDWRDLTESVMIDWNYDGAIFEPSVIDVPEKNQHVVGQYDVPKDAGTIRVKITDLLSQSLEMEVAHGKN